MNVVKRFFVKVSQTLRSTDKETARLIKQSKTIWGENLAQTRLDKLAKSKNITSAKKKIGKILKSRIPVILDDMTDIEAHDYILNEDTMKTLSAGKNLFGGFFGEGFSLTDLFKRDPDKKDETDKDAMKPE